MDHPERSALEHARLFISQGRPDRAESHLRQALSQQPGDPTAHALLSLCLTDLDRHAEATAEAEQAIAAAPAWELPHYAHAVALLGRGRTEQARAAIGEAMRIEPNDADHWEVLARVEFLERNWSRAIEAAERGLALDPEHIGCTNMRGMALAQQGDPGASAEMVRQSLAQDPENASSHTVAGWTYLQQGNMQQAGEHFREALRLDPNDDSARSGLLEVLKARNVLYRGMLRFFLWMGTQSKNTIWVIVIGIWIVPRVLRSVARSNPELEPIVMPIVALFAGFIYLTWVVDPVFEAMLFLHPLGRHALKPHEKTKALTTVALMGLGILALVVSVTAGVSPLFLPGVILLSYVIPLNVAFEAKERHRRVAVGSAAVLGLIGLILASMSLLGHADNATAGLMMAYFLGVLVISFLSMRWSLDPRED